MCSILHLGIPHSEPVPASKTLREYFRETVDFQFNSTQNNNNTNSIGKTDVLILQKVTKKTLHNFLLF